MGVVIGEIIIANYRESRRSQWPFIDHTSTRDIPSSEVIDLSTLVEQILSVFQQCYNDSLKEKWARTALQVCVYNLSVHPSIYPSIHFRPFNSHIHPFCSGLPHVRHNNLLVSLFNYAVLYKFLSHQVCYEKSFLD